MAWYISKDKIENESKEGKFWSNFSDGVNTLERCIDRCQYKFRMLDDEGEVYYEGYSNNNYSEKAFAPLDDFGMPNAGCTEIQYLHNGKWETL